MVKYRHDEDADNHDDHSWVVDRSGLGLDLIKRKHFSFTHSGGGGRNQIYGELLALLCAADQQWLLVAGNAPAHISHCQ